MDEAQDGQARESATPAEAAAGTSAVPDRATDDSDGFFVVDDSASDAEPARADDTIATPDADPAKMGLVEGPEIDLGVGRHRVNGCDVNLFRALVRDNRQTIYELRNRKPGLRGLFARRPLTDRPRFVTEGWLDRVNRWSFGWLINAARGLRRRKFNIYVEPLDPPADDQKPDPTPDAPGPVDSHPADGKAGGRPRRRAA